MPATPTYCPWPDICADDGPCITCAEEPQPYRRTDHPAGVTANRLVAHVELHRQELDKLDRDAFGHVITRLREIAEAAT